MSALLDGAKCKERPEAVADVLHSAYGVQNKFRSEILTLFRLVAYLLHCNIGLNCLARIQKEKTYVVAERLLPQVFPEARATVAVAGRL